MDIDATAVGNDLVSIKWNAVNGDEYEIYEPDIAISKNGTAWFQTSRGDDHKLIVYCDSNRFEWVPHTYNPVFGCECIYLGWRDKFLLYIYLEKHDIYICTIQNKEVKHIHFNGEHLFVGEDFVTYGSFSFERKGKVSLVRLPELDVVEKISLDEAQQQEIVPIYYQDYYQ